MTQSSDILVFPPLVKRMSERPKKRRKVERMRKQNNNKRQIKGKKMLKQSELSFLQQLISNTRQSVSSNSAPCSVIAAKYSISFRSLKSANVETICTRFIFRQFLHGVGTKQRAKFACASSENPSFQHVSVSVSAILHNPVPAVCKYSLSPRYFFHIEII